MLKKETVIKVLAMLQVYFEVKEPVSAEQAKIYAGIFDSEDITDEQLIGAGWQICKNADGKYGRLPTAKEILDCARPNEKFKAIDAWRIVLRSREKSLDRAMTLQSDPPEPNWLDTPEGQASKKAIEAIGGWLDFCQRKPDDFKRKDFIEYFQSYIQDGQRALAGQGAGQQQKALEG